MSDREEAKDIPVVVGFDQTNGAAQGLGGDSDGTEEEADREGAVVPNVLGARDDFDEAASGADDGVDPNP